MGKKLELYLPELHLRAKFELFEHEAPKTCKAIWQSLPIESEVTNARASGKEVYFPFSSKFKAPPENTIVYPLPGDCYYFQYPAGYTDERREKQHCGIMAGRSGWDQAISVVYGRCMYNAGGRCIGANLFARIVEGLEEFVDACEYKIYRGGSKKIVARKLV